MRAVSVPRTVARAALHNSKLRLNSLTVGNDARNRTLLNAYGTKTARNAPSASGFVFGPAKWIRHLIQAPPGRALVHRDFTQQEPRISAVLSDDRNLLAACEGSDLYLATAEQLGFMRESMNADERALCGPCSRSFSFRSLTEPA